MFQFDLFHHFDTALGQKPHPGKSGLSIDCFQSIQRQRVKEAARVIENVQTPLLSQIPYSEVTKL